MPDKIHIALFGAAGKMGRAILLAVQHHPRLQITHGYDPSGVSQFYGSLQIELEIVSLPSDVHVALDFSAVAAVSRHLYAAAEAGIPYVCGVTGLSEELTGLLKDTSNLIPIVYAPNMAPGMNLVFQLATEAAKSLPDYKRHIIETHHSQKTDAPSGTAKRVAEEIKKVTGTDTDISSLRMGDVTGEHRILFGGPGESIEIIHRADSRMVFAHGALRACEWIKGKPAGLYGMKDVLGLE